MIYSLRPKNMSRVDICNLVLHVFPTEPKVPLLPRSRSRSHSLPAEPDDGRRLAARRRPPPPPPPLSATTPPAPRRPRRHHPSRLTPHAASFPNVKHAFFLSILPPLLSHSHVFTSPGHGSGAPSFLAFLTRRLLGGLQRGRWRSSPSSPPESKAFEDRDKPASLKADDWARVVAVRGVVLRHLLVDCCVCSGLKVCAWKEWQHLQVEGVAVQGHLQQWSELIQERRSTRSRGATPYSTFFFLTNRSSGGSTGR